MVKTVAVQPYGYVDLAVLGRSATQYDEEFDLSECPIVEARYVKSFMDKGNPLVEALPKPLGIKELIHFHTNSVCPPTEEEMRYMDTYEKVNSVEILNNYRVAFPFHADLELAFHNALVNSYRARKIRSNRYVDIKYQMDGKDKVQHQLTSIRHVSNASTGFTLLGVSGCGKSTAVNMMLDRYPQVIVHNPNTLHEFPQIVWLHVNATANSNFSLLYDSIGRAIDRALNNLSPVYEREVAKISGLGKKYARIRELVELFSIGVIILDEIELMDTETTRENSLETLLTLTNETGVAIAVVGTEDAYQGLFSKRRTARRTGVLIQGSAYCENMARFRFILQSLFEITWFRPQDTGWLGERDDGDGKKSVVVTKIPDDIVEVMYRKTDGVISDIIGVYKEVTREYIRNQSVGKGYTKITAGFIERTADKYFEGLRRIADKMKERKEVAKKARQKALELINTPDEIMLSQDAEEQFNNIVASDVFHKEALLRENVITAITRDNDFPKNAVAHAFLKMMEGEDVTAISLQKAIELTLKVLLNREKKKARKKDGPQAKKLDIDRRRRELLDTQGDDFD